MLRLLLGAAVVLRFLLPGGELSSTWLALALALLGLDQAIALGVQKLGKGKEDPDEPA